MVMEWLLKFGVTISNMDTANPLATWKDVRAKRGIQIWWG